MGPRSVERGKDKVDANPTGLLKLQWGRVLLNAERVINANVPKVDEELQWGRVLLNAERNHQRRHQIFEFRFNGAAFC